MNELTTINNDVIKCSKCPRLSQYTNQVANEKVKRYKDQEYWGKPVPGFGDPSAKLIIIGLAPAAHGANRTGRMFTGDSSGDWLYKALHQTVFANQPESKSMNDGLMLTNAFINAVIRCAPPQNKPSVQEIKNCRSFLIREFEYFKSAKVYITLGRIAFDNFCKIHDLKKLQFGHNQLYHLSNKKYLISSYHPSRQNTQTGKLKWHEWISIFKKAKKIIGDNT